MKVYKAIRFVEFNLTTVKKGDRVFAMKDEYNIGISYQPEGGGYPIPAKLIENYPENFKKIRDLPYDPDYYLDKRVIKNLKAEIKKKEEKYKNKLHL